VTKPVDWETVKQNWVSFGTAATVRLRIRSSPLTVESNTTRIQEQRLRSDVGWTYLSRLPGNGGVFEACGNVGVNHEFGQSVGQDFAKAAALHKKARDGDVRTAAVTFETCIGVGRVLCRTKPRDKICLKGHAAWVANGAATGSRKSRKSSSR
jgi:hypothetical protein